MGMRPTMVPTAVLSVGVRAAHAGERRTRRERTPCARFGCSADSVGFAAGGFGVRDFARALAAFAYASGFRFLKNASVSLACFAESTQVLPFADAGRGYVRRKCARTTLPEIPSVAAISSGRNVLAVAIAITSSPVRESAYAPNPRGLESSVPVRSRTIPDGAALRAYARDAGLAAAGAEFMPTEYAMSVRSRIRSNYVSCVRIVRLRIAYARSDLRIAYANVRSYATRCLRWRCAPALTTTPPAAPPRCAVVDFVAAGGGAKRADRAGFH